MPPEVHENLNHPDLEKGFIHSAGPPQAVLPRGAYLKRGKANVHHVRAIQGFACLSADKVIIAWGQQC